MIFLRDAPSDPSCSSENRHRHEIKFFYFYRWRVTEAHSDRKLLAGAAPGTQTQAVIIPSPSGVGRGDSQVLRNPQKGEHQKVHFQHFSSDNPLILKTNETKLYDSSRRRSRTCFWWQAPTGPLHLLRPTGDFGYESQLIALKLWPPAMITLINHGGVVGAL